MRQRLALHHRFTEWASNAKIKLRIGAGFDKTNLPSAFQHPQSLRPAYAES